MTLTSATRALPDIPAFCRDGGIMQGLSPYAASRFSGWHMQCTPPPACRNMVMSGS